MPFMQRNEMLFWQSMPQLIWDQIDYKYRITIKLNLSIQIGKGKYIKHEIS